MVEHLAKLAAIHPSATCRAAIKVLCFIFGRMGLATADMVAAWELNDRTVLFGHWEISHGQGISDLDNPHRPSAVPDHSRRQLLTNAAMAASRVAA
jgi:hypothetical protein